MKSVLFAAMVGLLVSLAGTPIAIRVFRKRGFGQLIREDWGETKYHEEKRGTPTMGGAVIIIAVGAGYAASHAVGDKFGWAGLLVLGTMAGMGIVGFLDDYIGIRKQRSLGLNKKAKFIGQGLVAVAFALGVRYLTDAPTTLSFVRSSAIHLGPFFVLWVFLMMSAATNGVNLTDGLDGLAAGSSALVYASYVFIAFWQFRHNCFVPHGQALCYANIPDALDLAVVAAAALGACAGFLWWNAAPARIIMGDTGSLALGGGLAGLAVLTSTQLLLVILGGLFVLETSSVIMQIIAFRGFRRRIFRMAPIHHHFELGGWPEFTVIVRFWIIAGLAAALGLGIFYADFLARGGVP